ncbi:MAG: excinuclease ABC subunit UvrB [Bradymonadales bacterium]|nr:MAG: excinuclease ABC subunit UvrB [Bradymonadales bacterium]
MKKFELETKFKPAGGQVSAIRSLIEGIEAGVNEQVLLGITGSGKTFSMANVIAHFNRPTLVIAHNKTLATQLFMEFRDLFPRNAVEYFVSYFDYYQPEAYVPSTDTYIEKDSAINETIDKMRHSATRSLLERRDVIVVASVSCIYGLGSPEDYRAMLISLSNNQKIKREELIAELDLLRYSRRDDEFARGCFRVRGDVIEIFPASEERRAVRVELFGDYIDRLSEIDPLTGKKMRTLDRVSIYPTTHYITAQSRLQSAIEAIEKEFTQRLAELKNERKVLEAKRLEQRINFDLEMLRELGFCPGIENYSRHLTGRAEGESPYTLIDYFPKDYLLFIDESHVSIPQIGGMYRGDRSRKQVLVDHGFRLPSALDNRPLKFEEFLDRMGQCVYVSATPADFEMKRSEGRIVEQVVRPTGLLDPKINIYPATNQVDRLVELLREQITNGERTLVATLTKKSAENLCQYLNELGFRVRYMHADVETMERSQLLKDLRAGVYDILVGINLLREGLDLPEVSLVAILDADKEGFLRSKTSLLQMCGRAARNLNGRVAFFADEVTTSMQECIQITDERRKLQEQFNLDNGIKPEKIQRELQKSLEEVAREQGFIEVEVAPSLEHLGNDLKVLEAEKLKAVKELDFEKAAKIRDRMRTLQEATVFEGKVIQVKD